MSRLSRTAIAVFAAMVVLFGVGAAGASAANALPATTGPTSVAPCVFASSDFIGASSSGKSWWDVRPWVPDHRYQFRLSAVGAAKMVTCTKDLKALTAYVAKFVPGIYAKIVSKWISWRLSVVKNAASTAVARHKPMDLLLSQWNNGAAWLDAWAE